MITKPVGGKGCGGKRGGVRVVCKQCVCACVSVCVLGGAGKRGNHRIDEGSLHTEHMQGSVLAYNKPG